jgi:hypothetical protein
MKTHVYSRKRHPSSQDYLEVLTFRFCAASAGDRAVLSNGLALRGVCSLGSSGFVLAISADF